MISFTNHGPLTGGFCIAGFPDGACGVICKEAWRFTVVMHFPDNISRSSFVLLSIVATFEYFRYHEEGFLRILIWICVLWSFQFTRLGKLFFCGILAKIVVLNDPWLPSVRSLIAGTWIRFVCLNLQERKIWFSEDSCVSRGDRQGAAASYPLVKTIWYKAIVICKDFGFKCSIH